MADRDYCPVQYAMEKKVVTLSAHITFGASGAPTLDTSNSKGFCNVAQFTTSFTATASSTASYTAVSNFTNLYNGMIMSGTNVAAGSVISAINAGAGTLTSAQASTGVVSAVTATGGYVLQLGRLAALQVDNYVKILGFSIVPDLSGLPGAAATQASVPAAPGWFMFRNNVSASIPSSSGVLAATIGLMCGTWSAGTFVQKQPASGEGIYFKVQLGNSTAL